MPEHNRGDGFARLLERWRTGGDAAPAILMGVVNVTPDSFSDGGQFTTPEAAIGQARRLAAEGAAIIDIGGESTRPGAERVSAHEETARILPVISALAGAKLLISADTVKASVADQALAAGAHIANDVQGLQGDADMAGVVASHGAGVVVMHNPGLTGSSKGTQGDRSPPVWRFLKPRSPLPKRPASPRIGSSSIRASASARRRSRTSS